MASLESDTFLELSLNLQLKIEESLNSCNNMKASYKANIKEAVKKLMDIISRQEKMISSLKSSQNSDFNAFIESQKQLNDKIIAKLDLMAQNKITIDSSYACRLKTGLTSTFVAKKPPKDNKNIVIVRPQNGANNKQTVNELKKAIKKSNKTIDIKEVENIGNGRVIIRCQTEEDVKELQEVSKACHDIHVTKPKHKKPSICVYNIDSDVAK